MKSANTQTAEKLLHFFEISTPAISGLLGKAIYFPKHPHKWSKETLASLQAHAQQHCRSERDVSTVWQMVSRQRDALFSRYGYLHCDIDYASPHALNEWVSETPDAALRALAILRKGERKQQSCLYGHHAFHAFNRLFDVQLTPEAHNAAFGEALSAPNAPGELPDIHGGLLWAQDGDSRSDRALLLPGSLCVSYNPKSRLFTLTLPSIIATALEQPVKIGIASHHIALLQAALEAYYQLFIYAGMDNMRIGLTAPSGRCSLASTVTVSLPLKPFDNDSYMECAYLLDGELKANHCIVASEYRSDLGKEEHISQLQLMHTILKNPKHHASKRAEEAIMQIAVFSLRSLMPVTDELHRSVNASSKKGSKHLYSA